MTHLCNTFWQVNNSKRSRYDNHVTFNLDGLGILVHQIICLPERCQFLNYCKTGIFLPMQKLWKMAAKIYSMSFKRLKNNA